MCARMSTGDGEVNGVVKGLLASRESFGLLEGSDWAIQTQQTCMHDRISKSSDLHRTPVCDFSTQHWPQINPISED